ncbi:prepilin-type N-terminal cleavage/methylation domain-containing protein [Thalassotalea sp. G2M2-11]|uniref:prepilin-type N-terminal cleavage/methylation domain-containing protein n=1 Tax=Thalassotalea sp. G2M2-11 TaxID=2787627 RepID=UPI0019D2954B|nr:prepilin-type N-terminal cleavage/methylation domain-containing protein [Thalassotalea sp. G2M2-11]
MTRRSCQGFTLIELLISVSILSLLLLVGSFSYSLLADNWQDVTKKFDIAENDSRAINYMISVFSGIFPYVVYQNKIDKKAVLFFTGNEHRILSVTHSGLVGEAKTELFRVEAITNANGKLDLMYYASELSQPIIYADQKVELEQGMVLIKNMDSVSFQYLGWDSYQQKYQEPEQYISPSWRNRFSGITNQLLPETIEIKLSKQGKQTSIVIQLDKTSSRLLSSYYQD